MIIEQVLFWFAAFSMISYIYIAARRFDVFTVAAISSLVYLLPVFYGEISGPVGYPNRPIEPVLYLCFSVYCIAILIAAYVSDKNLRGAASFIKCSESGGPIFKIMAYLFVVMWFISLVVVYQIAGDSLFSGGKKYIPEQAGVPYMAFNFFALIAAVMLLSYPNMARAVFAALILGATLIAGQRTFIALAGVAMLLLWTRRWGELSIAKRFPVSGLAVPLLAVLTMSVLKPFYSVFRSGGIDELLRVFSSEGVFTLIARGAEFMSTQYYFNEIVRTGFSTDGLHVLRAPLSLSPFPRSWFGSNSGEFGLLYKEALFSDIEYGLASNQFGEMYAAAGTIGVILFIVLHVFVLYGLNRAILSRMRAEWVVCSVIVASLLSFYFYRNSLAVSFGFIRFVVWPYIFVWIAASVVAGALYSNRGRHVSSVS